jgi:hypothetical protein
MPEIPPEEEWVELVRLPRETYRIEERDGYYQVYAPAPVQQ